MGMVKTKGDIERIAAAMPFYEAILAGETTNQCTNFSSQLRDALLAEGVPTIMVASEDEHGFVLHNYLFCRIDEGVVLVDPTANQFLPNVKGVYIGERNDLSVLAEQSGYEDWHQEWPLTPTLYPPMGSEPTKDEKIKFQNEWGSTNTIQYEDDTNQITSQKQGPSGWHSVLKGQGNTGLAAKIEAKTTENNGKNRVR